MYESMSCLNIAAQDPYECVRFLNIDAQDSYAILWERERMRGREIGGLGKNMFIRFAFIVSMLFNRFAP